MYTEYARMRFDRREQEEDLPHCCICQAIPYFAWARCSCRPGKLACLEHAYYGCLCGSESKTMEVFVSDRRLLHLVEVTHRRMLAHRRPVPVRTRRAADGDESECEVDDETRCTKATFNWQCKVRRGHEPRAARARGGGLTACQAQTRYAAWHMRAREARRGCTTPLIRS